MAKKYYPKIKFALNLKEEKAHFLERDRSLRRFLPVGMGFVCRKEFVKNKNKILSAYLDEYYREMNGYLTEGINTTRIKWQKVENIFFKEVDRLFHNWPWPRGNYRGYVSIARSYPRYINKKIFAFPMASKVPEFSYRDLKVIAHEMLHFMEYDYLQKKFKLKPSESFSKDNTFWQFTENLNVLLESTDTWTAFTNGYLSKPYPDCKKLYVKMKKIWDKNKDIDNLVEKIFKLK